MALRLPPLGPLTYQAPRSRNAPASQPYLQVPPMRSFSIGSLSQLAPEPAWLDPDGVALEVARLIRWIIPASGLERFSRIHVAILGLTPGLG